MERHTEGACLRLGVRKVGSSQAWSGWDKEKVFQAEKVACAKAQRSPAAWQAQETQGEPVCRECGGQREQKCNTTVTTTNNNMLETEAGARWHCVFCGQISFHPISVVILAAWAGWFPPLTDDEIDALCG